MLIIKSLPYCLALFVVFVAGCNKQELHTGPEGFNGKGRAVIDGQEVRFVARMQYDDLYGTIDSMLYISFGAPSITMIPDIYTIELLPDSLLYPGSRIDFEHGYYFATEELNDRPTLNLSSWGGDMITAIYQPDSTAESYILIQEVTDQSLSFTFTFNLVHIKGIINVAQDDTFRDKLPVTLGEIKVPLPAEWKR